jgi:hypothetical protein
VSTSQNVVRKRYGLFVLAILLLLFGGVGIYLGSNNYPIRVLGLTSIMTSVYLARISRVHSGSSLPEARGPGKNFKIVKGTGRLLWNVSLALVPLLGISGFLLHIDDVNGGHEAWPADIFAGVGLACAIVWGYLAAKIFSGGTGKNS